MTHTRAVWAMVLVTLLWSTAGVVTRHLEHARSFEVTFWRSLFTVVSLLVLLPATGGARATLAALRHGGRALWLSGLCWGTMFTAFMVAVMLMPVAKVLVTMAAAPLFTALVARIFIGHRIAPRTWGAIVAAGLGIVWMYGSQIDTLPIAGTLVALCVPLAAAVNWTVVQNSQRHGESVNLMPALLIGAVLSSLVTLPLALPFAASPRDVGLLGLLGLFQLAIPCMLAVRVARVLPAPEVALLSLLEVIFGILLVWVGAGERPSAAVLTGGTLVIGALVVNELLGWNQARQTPLKLWARKDL